MKVAIDASCLVINRFSGLSEVVHNLLVHLPHAAEDNLLTIFMNYFRATGSTGSISYPGTVNHFLRLPRRLVDQWWKYDWLPFDLYLKGIDVFHSLHIKVPPTKRMRTVLTVHDCRYLTLPELYKPKEVDNYRREMKKSLNRVDRVAAVSEFTRQEILTYFQFPKDRIRVIHNGFSPYRPHGSSHEEKVKRFIEKNKFPQSYLLYAGTLDPRKNLLRLIEATARCRRESYDFPDLVIIGVSQEQFFRSEQGNKARELGLFDHIHLGGVIEKDILCGLIEKAVCLCYPSLYEGFGFPPLEAMSLGVPVLTGNKSSIPEITGHAACLVDPGSVDDIAQGLNRMVSDSDYRQILIESGYRQITKFSWEKAAADYISLYKEVLDS